MDFTEEQKRLVIAAYKLLDEEIELFVQLDKSNPPETNLQLLHRQDGLRHEQFTLLRLAGCPDTDKRIRKSNREMEGMMNPYRDRIAGREPPPLPLVDAWEKAHMNVLQEYNRKLRER